MKKILLKKAPSVYKNIGQQAELAYKYNMTGKIEKADNIDHRNGTDFEDCQIKSYHATVAIGTTDIEEYLKDDKATYFVYVTKDFTTAYKMNKYEYIQMVKLFTTIDTDSTHQFETLRFRREPKEMMRLFNMLSDE